MSCKPQSSHVMAPMQGRLTSLMQASRNNTWVVRALCSADVGWECRL